MRKFIIKYSGYRTVLARNYLEASLHAFDCMISVSECIDIESIDSSDVMEYCEYCEQLIGECACKGETE